MTHLLPFAFALAGFLVAVPARAEPMIANRIVAVVGDEPITFRALQVRARWQLATLDRALVPPQEKAERRRKGLRRTLREMIDEKLVERAAQAAQIEVSDELMSLSIDKTAAHQNLSRDALRAWALEVGLTPVELTAHFRRALLEWLVLNRAYKEVHGETIGEARRQAFRAQWLEAQAREVGVEVGLVEGGAS